MATNAYKKPQLASAAAWWNLTPKQKRVLQQKRVYGLYGGETAASVGRAPYFWAQEFGSAAAGITGRRRAGEAFDKFKARAYDVAQRVINS